MQGNRGHTSTSSVVALLGAVLVLAPPCRPGQHVRDGVRAAPQNAAEQPADLLHTERHPTFRCFFAAHPRCDEYRMDQQGQRNMAVPALPSAHLVLIEAAFAFGRLEAGLNFPPAARDVHQGLPMSLYTTSRSFRDSEKARLLSMT